MRIWFGVTTKTSAMAGFVTETRANGSCRFSTCDFPLGTSSRSGAGSRPSARGRVGRRQKTAPRPPGGRRARRAGVVESSRSSSLLHFRVRLDLAELQPALVRPAGEQLLGHLVAALDEDRVRRRQGTAGPGRREGGRVDDQVVGAARLA